MNFEEIKHEFGWFTVFNCGQGVIAISEPYQNTQVTSYLICGDNQSILLDTGCGIGRMKKLVFTLTSITPIIFNSHPCAYHSNANKKFDMTHILNDVHGINTLTHELNDEWINAQEKLTEEDTTDALMNFTTVSNGAKYALGNKLIEVISNEKTQENGLMLADHENKCLFTGDIFDENAIANVEDKDSYCEGLKEIIETYKDYTWYYSTGEITSDSKKQALIEKYA